MVAGNLGGATFGGYSAQAQVQIQASQTEVINNLNKFKALLPDPTVAASPPHTDFDHIHPETSRKLRAEIDAIIAIVDAAPVA